jgi:RNA polymerase sigma-54 factor
MFEMSMSADMEARVTPALLNLAHMLALPATACLQLIEQELSENPALEEAETQDVPCQRCGGPVLEGLCLRCAYESSGDDSIAPLAGDEATDPLLFVAAPRSLAESLIADLRASLPEQEHFVAEALVGSLDERGLLPDGPESVAMSLGIDAERVAAVLERLREVGPTGIGARDVRECVLIQLDLLEAEGLTMPNARAIVDLHMDDLAAHRYHKIARALGITTAEVGEARAFLQRYTWPYPAQPPLASAADPDTPRYRLPDVAIHDQDGAFVVEVLHSPRRILRLNPLYQELARRTSALEESERAHVQEYMARARVFLANLQQRESTLRRVTEAVVARQEAFLRHGVRHLAPLTRTEIAGEIGVHESTVSRTTADKVVLLPEGKPMDFSEFFVAARSVQDVLRELIENEERPLSDGELAELLAARGYPIARRTVAKYRERLNIMPAHLR